MGYYLPETATRQPDLTAKNRVWGFFGESVSVCLETRRAALETHQENYAGPQETVSGIPLWPSRDPIGEMSGMNLYGFVGNAGVNYVDVVGMDAALPPGWTGFGRPYNPAANPFSNHQPYSLWPREINEQVNEKRVWHHTRQEVWAGYCGCSEENAAKIAREALKNFSEFNVDNDIADVQVDSDSAGFNLHGFDGFLSDFINSDRAGVTLSGGGDGYDQQAITNVMHPIFGKRRWGSENKPSIFAEGMKWKVIEIYTEAYETTNNLNWMGGRHGWNKAIELWNGYLNRVADKIVSECGGARDDARLVTEGSTNEMTIPW